MSVRLVFYVKELFRESEKRQLYKVYKVRKRNIVSSCPETKNLNRDVVSQAQLLESRPWGLGYGGLLAREWPLFPPL